MTDNSKTDAADLAYLEAQFTQIRAENVAPRDAVLDRIMMDADRVLANQTAAPVGACAVVPVGFGQQILNLIGGWASLGGLSAATVAGLWIGLAQPAVLTDVSAGLIGGTVDVQLLDDGIFAALEG